MEGHYQQHCSDTLHTSSAQVTIFAVGYALALSWLAMGLAPRALLGHSIGEYAAACLAGVIELPDAVRAVVARGRAMGRAVRARGPGRADWGVMVAVSLGEAAARAAWDEWRASAPEGASEVVLAAVNGPSQVLRTRR